MSDTPAAQVTSLWAPLRVRAFTAMWLAQLVSMLGIWMQTAGAQWLRIRT
ncbi:MFS transporter [Geodermatophilus sp. URMC 64]